jgi:CBS-domain-containing membrane protein
VTGAAATVSRLGRPRLGLRAELLLVALPTATVLLVFALVETFTKQRLLFASLAASAYLIYLDPEHATNQIKTLVLAQIGAAVIGFGALSLLGSGYPAAALAMVTTIAALVTLDLVHPPAVSTGLAFAFQGAKESSILLFGLAVGMIALLIVIERASLWMLARARRTGVTQ